MTVFDDVAAVVPGLPGDGRFLQSSIGFEEVSRAARLVLLEQLDAALDEVSQIWASADIEAQVMGLDPGVGQVDVLHVPPSNLHEGPRKSLINSGPEAFPNVSVMAFTSVRSGLQAFDQAQSSELRLFVECMAISGPVPRHQEVAHETIVDRRINRMTEAAALVMRRNPSLMGQVHGMQLPPEGGIGNNTWLKGQDKGPERFLWHGSRLVYTLQRHHA